MNKNKKNRFGHGNLFNVLALVISLVLPAQLSAATVAEQVKGRIVLDVESLGEAWYISPLSLKRHNLGRPEEAFEVMRLMGLGISNANLAGIPASDQPDNGGDQLLRERLAGRILLQVESRGEAWYVYPGDLRRYYLGRPQDAFQIMRELGLGITQADLQQITIARSLPSVEVAGVPFLPQAPLGEWNDIRQQEGCEEASVLMAMGWIYGQSYELNNARNEILAMTAAQVRDYGTHQDTSAADTVDRLFKGYFGYAKAEVVYDASPEIIVTALQKGQLVLAMVNGKELENPYFRVPAPDRHMIVVHGYDAATEEFITHEPGTRNGRDYRYSYEVIRDSLRDYASGAYVPIPEPPRRAIIVVSK